MIYLLLHLSVLETETELVDDNAQVLNLRLEVEIALLFKNDQVCDLCLSLIYLLELGLDLLCHFPTQLSIIEGLSTLYDSLFCGSEHLDYVVA